MNKILTLLIILLFVYCIYTYFNNTSNIEHFLSNTICTNIHATNYTNPIHLTSSDKIDNCVCNYDNSKIICSRYFSSNYIEPTFSNTTIRCHDTTAYNFELNTKLPDNSVCQYENNEQCIFPISYTNINSLYDIIDNPSEYASIINSDGSINYNNILTVGPCISVTKNRAQKLKLHYQIFNRKQHKMVNMYEPIFNIWDYAGKISIEQLKFSFGKTYKSYKFHIPNENVKLETNIDMNGYGIDVDINVSYPLLVDKINNTKQIALAISNNCDKYAIGIGNTADLAMDIAMMNAILFDKTNTSTDLMVQRSYTKTIYQFQKAKLLSADEIEKIKNNLIVNEHITQDIVDENKTLLHIINKLEENKTNPVAILMLNNKRYYKYLNDGKILTKCSNLISTIKSDCYIDKHVDVDGKNERNCNETVVLRYDNNTNTCSIVQKTDKLIKNNIVDLSINNSIYNDIQQNATINTTHSLLNDINCDKNGIDCFIYSINDKRFCKEL